MRLFFADDSRQNNPSRPGMSPLISVGGFEVDSVSVRSLEKSIDDLCRNYGFPTGASGEFKWSPKRNKHWMYHGLTGAHRQAFYDDLLSMAKGHDVTATVIIEDTNYKTATVCANPEEDVVNLLLERIEGRMSRICDDGIVIVDQPSGGVNTPYLAHCLQIIQSGTSYVSVQHIALNVLSTPSHLVRCLQLADVITACTLAYVSGEWTHSPQIFPKIRTLLDNDWSRIGGVGVKIHPDGRYRNLYHWLLGDTMFKRGSVGDPLPSAQYAYHAGPCSP